MSEGQVLKLLGPPDDVRTETDPGGIATTRTAKILRYGTSGHLTCASLGQVYVDQAGAVQYVFGGRGSPPSPTLISEPELARLLPVLHRVSSYSSVAYYEPLPLIGAVNALQPLGKEKALAAIGEYLRISSHFDDPAREGMFLVLRVLFDVPTDTGAMPRMGVGGFFPPDPQDPRAAPRFPIVLADDIPWLPIDGYVLGGLPAPPENHLAWFRAHGTLRASLLRPPDHPRQAFDGLLARLGDDPALRAVVVEQLLSLLDSVYRSERDASGLRFHIDRAGSTFDSEWRTLRARLSALKIRWDQTTNRYVFADGSALAEEQRPLYRRLLWPFMVGNVACRLVLERRDRRYVQVEVRAATRPVTVTARLASDRVLPRLAGGTAITEGQGQVESLDHQTIEVREGEVVRVEIESKGIKVTSPELRP